VRVGVFGGTFNPVHLGHLRAAEEVREALSLERVLFVPARVPPHKGGEPVAPADVRLELVTRAVGGNPGFGVSDLELRREGPSYSVDTLTELQEGAAGEGELWFLMGADAYREVHTWHRYAELFRLANVAVMRRPPGAGPLVAPRGLAGDFAATGEGLRHRSGRHVRLVDITLLDISSTQVRRALARGCSIRYLVPEAIRPTLEALVRDNAHWFAGSRG